MRIFIVILTILVFIISRFYVRYRRIKKLEWKAYSRAFENQNIELPKLDISSSYGYPTFNVHFKSKADFKLADEKGLLKIFKEEIQKIHNKEGQFDSQQAVFTKYDD